jgi:hypothetical protein
VSYFGASPAGAAAGVEAGAVGLGPPSGGVTAAAASIAPGVVDFKPSPSGAVEVPTLLHPSITRLTAATITKFKTLRMNIILKLLNGTTPNIRKKNER